MKDFLLELFKEYEIEEKKAREMAAKIVIKIYEVLARFREKVVDFVEKEM